MVVIRKSGAEPETDHEIQPVSQQGKLNWHVPEEVPVAFVYSRRNYAVMLATPDNLEDFAIGFSLTERIVNDIADIHEIDIRCNHKGVEFHIQIDKNKLERFDIQQQRRNIVGRTGCGTCGLENAETFFQTLPPVCETKFDMSPQALQKALLVFSDQQPLNKRTKSVHGAAWVSADGDIELVREDVGRHNALDKLLGALAQNATDFSSGLVMLSSRCSYELIEKSARLGVRAVATLSGPTAFAIRKAKEANIRLYCRSGDTFVDASGK